MEGEQAWAISHAVVEGDVESTLTLQGGQDWEKWAQTGLGIQLEIHTARSFIWGCRLTLWGQGSMGGSGLAAARRQRHNGR